MNANYLPNADVIAQSLHIPSQTFMYSLENIFNSFIPAQLCVAFVKSKAYSGDFKEIPYFFHHFLVNYIEFSVNGKSVPCEALTPSFTPLTYRKPAHRKKTLAHRKCQTRILHQTVT